MGRIQLTAPITHPVGPWMNYEQVAAHFGIKPYLLSETRRREPMVKRGLLPPPHPTHRGKHGVRMWHRPVVEAFEPAE